MQLFRGQFYHCTGENLRNVTTRQDCLDRGYRWENWKYNFDDLGNALMSLFVLSSKDGWVMIMYQGLDAVGVDMQVHCTLVSCPRYIHKGTCALVPCTAWISGLIDAVRAAV